MAATLALLKGTGELGKKEELAGRTKDERGSDPSTIGGRLGTYSWYNHITWYNHTNPFDTFIIRLLDTVIISREYISTIFYSHMLLIQSYKPWNWRYLMHSRTHLITLFLMYLHISTLSHTLTRFLYLLSYMNVFVLYLESVSARHLTDSVTISHTLTHFLIFSLIHM